MSEFLRAFLHCAVYLAWMHNGLEADKANAAITQLDCVNNPPGKGVWVSWITNKERELDERGKQWQ